MSHILLRRTIITNYYYIRCTVYVAVNDVVCMQFLLLLFFILYFVLLELIVIN